MLRMRRGRESSIELKEPGCHDIGMPRRPRVATGLTDALWPMARPGNWMELINTPLPAKEHKQIEHSANRGCLLSEEHWVRQTAEQLSLQSTWRPRGGQAKANI